jgi:hypothetical protein
VALLLAGTATAIVVAQHLRDEDPVASSIYWKKRGGPPYRVCFLLGRSDRVKVSVVDFSDREIRVLSDGELQGGDDPHCFGWDGRTSSGQPAPPGPYHLQLILERNDRTAVSGEHVTIRAGAQP